MLGVELVVLAQIDLIAAFDMGLLAITGQISSGRFRIIPLDSFNDAIMVIKD